MLLRLVCSVFLAATALAAERPANVPPSSASGTGEIIELPKFIVTDSRELPAPESWRYAAIPGLEVLSTVSATNTRRFVRDFHRLQQVVEIVWPAIASGVPGVPVSLVLCGRGNQFDTFVPTGPADAATRPTSLFLQDVDQAIIVVDYVADRFDDRPIAAGLLAPAAADPEQFDEFSAGAGFLTENDPFREFYLQYFRWVIRRGAGGEVPPWLEEGLVQLFASTEFSKDYIAVGRLRDSTGGQRPDTFTVRLARQPLLGLEQMLARQRPAGLDAVTYSPQCYAFVHLCLHGRKGKLQPALLKLAERAAAEPVTEQVFKECFGVGFREMEVMLRAHISYAAHEFVEVKSGRGQPGLEDPPAFAVREATQAEIGRITGEAYRLGGHTQRARLALAAPYVRGEHDAALLAALGVYACGADEPERARKFLEAAVQAGVARPRAYLELSRLNLTAARARAGGRSDFDANTVRGILRPLHVGHRHAAPLPASYEMMAEVWAGADGVPAPEELRRLQEGAQLFPRRLRLVYLVAALTLRHGDPADARALVEHGLRLAGAGGHAQHFQALQAQLK
jgi:hypothetical protein